MHHISDSCDTVRGHVQCPVTLFSEMQRLKFEQSADNTGAFCKMQWVVGWGLGWRGCCRLQEAICTKSLSVNTQDRSSSCSRIPYAHISTHQHSHTHTQLHSHTEREITLPLLNISRLIKHSCQRRRRWWSRVRFFFVTHTTVFASLFWDDVDRHQLVVLSGLLEFLCPIYRFSLKAKEAYPTGSMSVLNTCHGNLSIGLRDGLVLVGTTGELMTKMVRAHSF